MSKTRVYQIANELKMSNEDVLAKLKELEISAVDKEDSLHGPWWEAFSFFFLL